MVYYVCDGSKKRAIIGAGIVRVDECGMKKTFSYYGRKEPAENIQHEEYAIIKTLEMIEKKKDKKVIIYNDVHYEDKLSKKIKMILKILKNNGFQIEFLHPKKLSEKIITKCRTNLVAHTCTD